MKFIKPDWPAPENIKAFTTVRDAWGSWREENRYPIPQENEEAELKKLFDIPSSPIWINQITHSNIVKEATQKNREQIADATYTQEKYQICAVLTADCLPILVCNRKGTKVAAIHAGWRGLSNGIVENTLKAISEDPDDLLVWLGPAISAKKFEVGLDVYQAFVNHHAESKNAFKVHAEGKWLADLYSLAKIRLSLQGVTQIYGGDFCTYTQEELFFSYRRDKGKTGRMASLIWLGE